MHGYGRRMRRWRGVNNRHVVGRCDENENEKNEKQPSNHQTVTHQPSPIIDSLPVRFRLEFSIIHRHSSHVPQQFQATQAHTHILIQICSKNVRRTLDSLQYRNPYPPLSPSLSLSITPLFFFIFFICVVPPFNIRINLVHARAAWEATGMLRVHDEWDNYLKKTHTPQTVFVICDSCVVNLSLRLLPLWSYTRTSIHLHSQPIDPWNGDRIEIKGTWDEVRVHRMMLNEKRAKTHVASGLPAIFIWRRQNWCVSMAYLFVEVRTNGADRET